MQSLTLFRSAPASNRGTALEPYTVRRAEAGEVIARAIGFGKRLIVLWNGDQDDSMQEIAVLDDLLARHGNGTVSIYGLVDEESAAPWFVSPAGGREVLSGQITDAAQGGAIIHLVGLADALAHDDGILAVLDAIVESGEITAHDDEGRTFTFPVHPDSVFLLTGRTPRRLDSETAFEVEITG